MHNEKRARVAGKQVTLYLSQASDQPLIVLNNYSGDGASVIKAMEEIDTPDCNLLIVGDLKWDHDMTPWYCRHCRENDTPCTGGADEYLALFFRNPANSKNNDKRHARLSQLQAIRLRGCSHCTLYINATPLIASQVCPVHCGSRSSKNMCWHISRRKRLKSSTFLSETKKRI